MNIVRCFTIFIVFFLLIVSSCSINKKAAGTNTSDALSLAANVDTEYYMKVEKPATFQGKDVNAFISYLKTNTKYPVAALKKKQQGLVAIQFGVDCYGNTKFISYLKSSKYKLLDNEAKRAILSSPKWVPAKVGSKSVGQLFILQVKFNAVKKSIEIR